ncbi:ribosome hibernation-promoting factor, HPF/YfiA family [Deinococcus radiophilus]|uniref:Ribosome hibernation promoting factor n=1 Tax=Deinococcus radiophilus TaxID=32062 RepID=A0A3S0K9X2_9DEIO|nr:ribosome-associated translation inhibitor RaiA [Deinococcus radiophilus]RTR25908.1 ribosome-associated translation inhibitor RaiA [Deinococcus radiophilus]UFA49699.1 ribosome-associated translation inhibitor RaiA [Deinococcus radiophilus]
MNIAQLSGRGVEITDPLREYVDEKLSRLDRFNDQVTSARVTLTVRDVKDAARRNRVEVQLNVPHGIVRAEESHADMYAAIDKASDVLERQLRKFKTRLLKQRQEGAPQPEPGPAEMAAQQDDDLSVNPEIVRQKRFDLRPMTAEDAVFQMEALGHDFFVFKNMVTDGCGVVYRRKDGHYGLIEPK